MGKSSESNIAKSQQEEIAKRLAEIMSALPAKADIVESQLMMTMSVSSTLKPSAHKSWQTRCELTFRNGHAWLPFNIPAVVAVCSIPGIRCNRNRQTSVRKSHRPTGAEHSNCWTRTRRQLDRNEVLPALRPYTRRPE